MTSRTVDTVCPYCGVGCGMSLQVEGQQVIKVIGMKSHPTNFGRLCTKGTTSAQALRDSGRMETAFVRSGRTHEPVRLEIDAAIEETAQRLSAIRDAHGPDALSFYVSGQMSLEAQYLANKLAKGFVGTNNIESNSRLCMASAGSGYKLSLGSDGPPGSYQDFDRADVFFVIGANMADCHPILFLRMMDRVKAGAKLIVVDPRRKLTADKAHLHLQIKPGTDLALLNGLLHLLVQNDHIDRDFIERHTEGWDEMAGFLADYTPERVAAITGLLEDDVRAAARLIGEAGEWMSCWTMGLNQSTHGTWNTNAICNLHLATGAICRPGSGPFSLTGQPNAMGGREMGYMGPGLPGQRSVLVASDRKFVEEAWRVPAGTLRTDLGGGTVAMFDDMASGRIKACWIICTNPVATVPNRSRVIEALQTAELVITQDAFLDTETNRYADILLPGALWAEAEGVMINSERNLTLMQKAVDPPGDAMPDWQIIARVACAMGYAEAFSYACAEEVFEEIKQFWNPKTGYDIRGASYAGLRDAPIQWPCPPGASAERHPIRYLNDGASQKLRHDVDGHTPPIAFATSSGKAAFFARPHGDPAEMPDADFPFVLNTGRLQHQWHTLTKTGKIATLNKLNPGPFIEIHPEDATVLGVADKDSVEVRSRRGRAVLPAVVTDRVRAGSCFAPFHWNDLHGDDIAINAVTSDAIDPISQQPEFKFCAVTLTRVKQSATSQPATALPHKTAALSGATPALGAFVASSSQPPSRELDTMKISALATLLGLEAAAPPILEPHEKLYLQGFMLGLQNEEGRVSGGVPTLPPSAPLAPPRRLLIDGMLAGLFSRSWISGGDANAIAAAPLDDGTVAEVAAPDVVKILWASQTGNAEGIADRCARHLEAAGFAVSVSGMDSLKPAELASVRTLILVTSTFGDGDPPDNATAFWQALSTDDCADLPSLKFSVLVLGDSSYDQFCGFGRRLDERLHQLGAQRFVDRIECEPDFEESVTGWLTAVSEGLQAVKVEAEERARRLAAGSHEGGAPHTQKVAAPSYSRSRPLLTHLLRNERLNRAGSSKDTRQLVFDLKGRDLSYESGDALGVWPTNCANSIGDMLSALKMPSSAMVSVKERGDMPVSQALSQHYDVTKVTPDVLRFVAERSRSPELAELLKPENAPALKEWCRGKQIVDLLHDQPIAPSATEWLGVLKPLQPRLYSISSSPQAHRDEVHLTVSTVRYDANGKTRSGVCSTFLADRADAAEIPIFVQRSSHFRPPAHPDAPLIMVGPGTGVAPFRSFLHERRAKGHTGRNWLFFGEQHSATDFYYRDELEALQREGVLSKLSLAFSRDQADKVYVQDRMREQGAQIWAWLQEGAHFCVCGDASRMAKDVDLTLRGVVKVYGAMSTDKADDYVDSLSRDKRYLRDVY